MSRAVLLLITNSYDTTADLLIHRLGREKVFRFNYDLWHEYRIEITPRGFSLSNPSGLSIVNNDVVKVLWRKPWSRRAYRPSSRTEEELYYDGEVLYVMRELMNLSWLDGKIVLVEPFAEMFAGKFVQMRTAARFFQVPPFQFRLGFPSILPDNQETVVKSLTMEAVGNDDEQRHLLFTTKVDDRSLSSECPWMVQHYVAAEKDITVAFVFDRLFAFELDRRLFLDRVADWRELPPEWGPDDWQPHALQESASSAIFGFMKDMGLHFGRLDFLWGPGGYYFLEVNTNGEWAWLDTEGHHGLLQKVVEEISPDTPVHPVPLRGTR